MKQKQQKQTKRPKYQKRRSAGAITGPRRRNVAEDLSLAVRLHNAGRHSDATRAYNRVLQASPDHADALRLLGILSHQSGNSQVAVELIRKAITANPGFVDAYNNLGSVLKDQRRLDEAEEAYRKAIALKPELADAHNNLGAVLNDQEKLDEAVVAYRLAIALKPDFADAHNNLGAVFKAQGQPTQAVASYRQAISLNPRHVIAYYNLGIVLHEQGKLDEAVNAYNQAITLRPDLAAAHNNLGSVLKQQRKPTEAIVAFRMAITIEADHADGHGSLGRLLSRMGRPDEALAVYEHWLGHDANHPVALHMLAACEGREVPARASDEYLQQLFDGLADSFEENLNSLDYCGPELVAAALSQEVAAAAGQFDILDAGCGTGLCGPYLRPYARRLTGVDLSTGMLRKATERGIYDDLVTAELTEYLGSCVDAYDVIVAADTLVYFGDLKPLLTGVANSLRTNGLLVFSAESCDDHEAADGFLLQPHGRYSHTEKYLTQTLANAGLTVSSVAPATLRMEGGHPVPGVLVRARKLVKNR
jgi:predicted TPR repeat methyltransferase